MNLQEAPASPTKKSEKRAANENNQSPKKMKDAKLNKKFNRASPSPKSKQR
jgi:hypothetical protein